MKEGLAENKVLILYILNKLQDGIKNDNLYKIVSSTNNMNYFYFQELITDLIGLILERAISADFPIFQITPTKFSFPKDTSTNCPQTRASSDE